MAHKEILVLGTSIILSLRIIFTIKFHFQIDPTSGQLWIYLYKAFKYNISRLTCSGFRINFSSLSLQLMSELGMPGLGWRKAGEKISKGEPMENFWNFVQILKGFLLIYQNDVPIL